MAHDTQVTKIIDGWSIIANGKGWTAIKGELFYSYVDTNVACTLTNLQRACLELGIRYETAKDG